MLLPNKMSEYEGVQRSSLKIKGLADGGVKKYVIIYWYLVKL